MLSSGCRTWVLQSELRCCIKSDIGQSSESSYQNNGMTRIALMFKTGEALIFGAHCMWLLFPHYSYVERLPARISSYVAIFIPKGSQKTLLMFVR